MEIWIRTSRYEVENMDPLITEVKLYLQQHELTNSSISIFCPSIESIPLLSPLLPQPGGSPCVVIFLQDSGRLLNCEQLAKELAPV